MILFKGVCEGVSAVVVTSKLCLTSSSTCHFFLSYILFEVYLVWLYCRGNDTLMCVLFCWRCEVLVTLRYCCAVYRIFFAGTNSVLKQSRSFRFSCFCLKLVVFQPAEGRFLCYLLFIVRRPSSIEFNFIYSLKTNKTIANDGQSLGNCSIIREFCFFGIKIFELFKC